METNINKNIEESYKEKVNSLKLNNHVALLTDFGLIDSYAAQMKGVLYSYLNNLNVIDISHCIEPFNINMGAYTLWSSYKSFPAGTVFISVVDPGVGSNRKPILLKTENHVFIAPDNGILSYILDTENNYQVFEILVDELPNKEISSTFHGRDIFCYTAIELLKEIPLINFCKNYSNPVKLNDSILTECNSKPENSVLNGTIIHIDSFGNLISNIHKSLFKEKKIKCKIYGIEIDVLSNNYSDFCKSEIIMYIGSSDLIEFAEYKGNACKSFKATVGHQFEAIIE